MMHNGAEPDPETSTTYIARTDYRGASRLFGIKRKDRRQHTYLVGKTGTGKSSVLNNLIVQDIANGEGVCVIDPHGELVEGILSKIPEERMKDVIYFNPADTDYHIGFNILELTDPKYKHLVASGLMAIFTKIWAGVWSSRMEYILNNCILALLDTPGSTLLGIPRLLSDKDYRQKIIGNLKDPVVKAFWVHEFESWQERFRNEAIAPIQNKVGQFLSTALVRNIVGQSKSTIDVFDIMNEGKIFLVNVSKGRIGEDNSALLGAMLITKIQLAAMERVRIPEDERVDFYLYVDEFQNFATDSFAGILSEARKYRLNLTLAHQYVGQLVSDNSTKVRDAIFGNVGTMIVFRVGAADAEFLENEFTPEFTIEDIVNLPNYHIYIKLMVNGVTARPFSAETIPTFQVQSSSIVEEDIVAMSRKYYARSRQEIETEINRWSGVMDAGAQTAFSSGGGAAAGGGQNPGFGAGAGAGAAAVASAGAGSGGAGGDRGGASSGSTATATGTRFTAVCSSCGDTTSLPFEPTPGRPVYCRNCMKKIESGEMKPVRATWTAPAAAAPAKPKEKYTDALSHLGIEFAEEAEPATSVAAPAVKIPAKTFAAKPTVSSPSAPYRAPARAAQPTPVASVAAVAAPAIDSTPSVNAQPAQTLSLNDLAKPAEKTAKSSRPPREEVSINSLRDAIKASLNNDLAAAADETVVPPKEDSEEEDYYDKDRSGGFR